MILLFYIFSLLSGSCVLSISVQVPGKSKYHRIDVVPRENLEYSESLFTHGESPVWDAERQSLFFVDVKEHYVNQLYYATGEIFRKHIGYGDVNVVSLLSGSQRLVVAVRSSLYLLDLYEHGDNALTLLTTVDLGLPYNVINEGKPDAKGRFWAGTKGPQTGDDVVPDKATFYSVDRTRLDSPRIHLRPVSISNGLVWSLNNTILYYIDSSTKRVDAYNFDLEKGEIKQRANLRESILARMHRAPRSSSISMSSFSDSVTQCPRYLKLFTCAIGVPLSVTGGSRRTIINVASLGYTKAIPDGMTIDANGNLWVALMFGGAVLHINPDSKSLINAYTLPVSRVTSVCWGGPQLDILFITTARDNVNTTVEPLAGAIFKLQGTGFKGVQPYAFVFDDADFY